MSDLMTFPKTVDEFMEAYKIVDTEEVYTNGTELVPIFRMKQWFEAHEAIPVEWLEKKAQEFAERYWNKKDDHKKLILPMADCPIVIEQMIKEWRVENHTENN